MKIILTNGLELQPIVVTGESKYVQGANRDCLSFVFDDKVSLDEMDSIFTATNCESIKLVGDDGSEDIHTGYTIRAELKKTVETVKQGSSDSEVVTVNRVIVSMAERTYAETQLASLTETVDVLVMESLV